MRPLRLVAFAARDAGLALLADLERDPRWRIAGLFTHRCLPTREDPHRGERPEFGAYVALARRLRVPLCTIDTRPDAAALPGLAALRPFDLLLCVSWRYLVPAHVLRWPRRGAVNLHRGRLPEYAGDLPVARALDAGETRITVTALRMAEQIDTGPVLATVEHPVRRSGTPAEDVARIKREILPLYGPLAVRALERLCGLAPAAPPVPLETT